MCLSYAKIFVIFHVGTKWFVCGKPKPMTCWGLSENWPQYQDSAPKRKVGFLPGFVAVADISVNMEELNAFIQIRRLLMLLVLLKIFTLCSYYWLLKLSLDGESQKRMDSEQFQFSLFSMRKVRCEHLYSQIFFFFNEIKLYLLIRTRRPLCSRGSVLGLNQLSCSPCCLPLECPRQSRRW